MNPHLVKGGELPSLRTLEEFGRDFGGRSAMWWHQGGNWSRCRFAKPNQKVGGLGENDMPGGGFRYLFFHFSPLLWGNDLIWFIFLQMGWPPKSDQNFWNWVYMNILVRIYFFNQINVINVDILKRHIFFEWIEVNMDMWFLQACFLLQREIPAPFKEGLSHRYQVKNHLFCRWIRERSAPEGTFQPNRKGWIVFQAPTIFSEVNSLLNFGGVFQPKNKNE